LELHPRTARIAIQHRRDDVRLSRTTGTIDSQDGQPFFQTNAIVDKDIHNHHLRTTA